jgi:kumamolisin
MNAAMSDAAALGITVCVAAGDNGSDDDVTDGQVHVDFPASSPYALACGGTTLVADPTTGTISSEVVWNELASNEGATGGGVSDQFALPTWQAAAGVGPRAASQPGAAASGAAQAGGAAAGDVVAEHRRRHHSASGGGTGGSGSGGSGGSGSGSGSSGGSGVSSSGTDWRGVPDVAGNGDPVTGYQIYSGGQAQVVGGTSAVAPLWSALIARLAQATGTRFGLIQTLLYAGVSPGKDVPGFHDITSGNNGAYEAGPGWDSCSGLGSPDGTALLSRLQDS